MRRLWLASASPRRASLLASIGVPAQRLPAPDIDETPRPGESAPDYVQRMAREKARVGWARVPDPASAAVLGADTSVVLDNRILGKPRDPDEARAMLAALAGREHQVLSAVTVITVAGEQTALSVSRVSMAPLDSADIQAYVATGEPMDKAGGYAIQGFAAVFVEQLSGSYSGVVGLPLAETGQLLRQAGVLIWQQGETLA